MATGSESVGIVLGTSYACVGVWQNDRVEIVANGEGKSEHKFSDSADGGLAAAWKSVTRIMAKRSPWSWPR